MAARSRGQRGRQRGGWVGEEGRGGEGKGEEGVEGSTRHGTWRPAAGGSGAVSGLFIMVPKQHRRRRTQWAGGGGERHSGFFTQSRSRSGGGATGRGRRRGINAAGGCTIRANGVVRGAREARVRWCLHATRKRAGKVARRGTGEPACTPRASLPPQPHPTPHAPSLPPSPVLPLQAARDPQEHRGDAQGAAQQEVRRGGACWGHAAVS